MPANTQEEPAERLERLLLDTPIADTHNDFPYLLRVQLHNEITSNTDFHFDGQLTSHTDLNKLQTGRVGLQFFSCFIECKNDDYLYQDFNFVNNAVRDTVEQIDVIRRLVDEFPQHMEYVTSAAEARKAYLESGKIAVTMGVEGLHQVDTSLAVLRRYHELGVRYVTLTHNCDNPFATAASSVVAGLPDKGLTEYGRQCVLEMNRLGLMCDLSHVSYKTMLDTLEATKSPVIFSHSSAYALTHNERNVRDDVLRKLHENGGVCCVNFFPNFITADPETNGATIDDAVNHILHIATVAGWENVGLGSDFDGIPAGPVGLEDVSKYPDLICKVMERCPDVTDDQLRGLMGANVLRCWEQNELVSAELKAENTKIVEANWKDRIWDFYKYVETFPEIYPGSSQKHVNNIKDTQELVITKTQK